MLQQYSPGVEIRALRPSTCPALVMAGPGLPTADFQRDVAPPMPVVAAVGVIPVLSYARGHRV